MLPLVKIEDFGHPLINAGGMASHQALSYTERVARCQPGRGWWPPIDCYVAAVGASSQ